MILNMSTDYGLRIAVYLAQQRKVVSSSELSKKLKISQRYILQVSSKLRDAGVLQVIHGQFGGFILAKPPNELSIYDIAATLQEETKLRRKVLVEPVNSDDFNNLYEIYAYLDNLFEGTLKRITICHILNKKPSKPFPKTFWDFWVEMI